MAIVGVARLGGETGDAGGKAPSSKSGTIQQILFSPFVRYSMAKVISGLPRVNERFVMSIRESERHVKAKQRSTSAMGFILKNVRFPVRLRPFKPMNDEELMQFCAANSDLRIEREEDGELLVMAPAGSEGGSVEFGVGRQLADWAESDGRGKMFGPNSGFKLPDGSVRAADAAWVSWPRWNALSRKQQKGYSPICPEFVIEVRSQSDRLPPLRKKMEKWIANGAEVAWLVDTERNRVWIYRPGQSPEFHDHASSINGTGPVEGFVLSLD